MFAPSLKRSFHALEVDMAMSEAITNVMVMRLFYLCCYNKVILDFFLIRELIVIPYLEYKGKWPHLGMILWVEDVRSSDHH